MIIAGSRSYLDDDLLTSTRDSYSSFMIFRICVGWGIFGTFIEIFPLLLLLVLLSCIIFYPFCKADDRLVYDDNGVSVTYMSATFKFFVASTSSGSMSCTKRVLLWHAKMRNLRLTFSLCVAPILYLTRKEMVKSDHLTPTNLLFLEKIESLVIDTVILSIINLCYDTYLWKVAGSATKLALHALYIASAGNTQYDLSFVWYYMKPAVYFY